MSEHRIVAEVEAHGMDSPVYVAITCDHGGESEFWLKDDDECVVMQWFENLGWEAFMWARDVKPFTDLALPAKIDVEPNGDDGWIMRPI